MFSEFLWHYYFANSQVLNDTGQTNELLKEHKEKLKQEQEDFEKKEQEQLGKQLAKEYKRRQDKVRDYDYGYDDLYVGGNKKIKGGNMLTDMLYGRSNLPRRRLPLPRRVLPTRNKKTLSRTFSTPANNVIGSPIIGTQAIRRDQSPYLLK